MIVLGIGSTGHDVAAWQHWLARHGFRDRNGRRLGDDGTFGSMTSFATQQYQASQSLRESGALDVPTYARATAAGYDPETELTQDLSEGFFRGLVEACERLECLPLDVLGVWMNESRIESWAHNPNGNASGIFQAMPATLRNLGFQGTHEDFRKLTAEEQLPWAERYYAPHKGKLATKAALYVCTFLPADLDAAFAGGPEFVLVDAETALDLQTRRAWAYLPNKGFDANGDGRISVAELEAAIDRACRGHRWSDVRERLTEVLASS